MTEDRARSFMERYMIARASHFRTGPQEVEDMHACTQMAKSAYRHIANVSRSAEPDAYPDRRWQDEAGMNTPAPVKPAPVKPAPMIVKLMTAQGPIDALNTSKKTWLEAGKETILEAMGIFTRNGVSPPDQLIDAAQEALSNGKTP